LKLLLRPLALVCALGIATLIRAATSVVSNPQGPVLVLGDSLSAGYGLKAGEGWVSLLADRMKFAGYGQPVVNASVSGETTTGGLNRLPRALTTHHPSVVIVELGANDALRGLPATEIADRLVQIANRARQSGALVLMIGTPLPANYGEEYTRSVAAAFRRAADETHAPLVPSLLAGIPVDERNFQADHLHPAASVQARMLDNVWGPLKRVLPSSAPSSGHRHE
jgi:acyl-CoA thioesterase I